MCRSYNVLYLGEVVKNIEAALGDGDVHGVFGADVDSCPRFRKNDKVVSVNRTPVLDRVVLHLQEQRQQQQLKVVHQVFLPLIVIKLI